MNKQEVFIRKKEVIIEKWIKKILNRQLKQLVEILSREVKIYSIKSIEDDVFFWIESIKAQIPEYLFTSLQPIMQSAYKQSFNAYKNWLPDYKNKLIFNVDTEPAVRYLRNLENLHLSERDWSIFKTTKKEILTLLAEWVKSWKSYTQIWEEIQNINPFVFSEERAKLIAIQETWQAYWWANYEPAREMVRKGYVMEKKWVTSHDWKVRDTHHLNETQGWIPLDNPWSWTWDMYAPSKDFRCRCTSSTRIIW